MPIAYGLWRYGRDDLGQMQTMVAAARELGIDHFDTADVYGYPEVGAAERLLGALRDKAPSLLEGAEIATKAGVDIGTPYNASRAYIEKAIDASLERLQTNCIDLFYIHRPDMLAHPAETAAALDAIIASGKAKSLGVSNYAPEQIKSLNAFLQTPLSAHQVEFSTLHVNPAADGVFDQAMANDMRVYAWSPLGGGRLFTDGDTQSKRVRYVLSDIAERYECSPMAAALAFVMTHPAGVRPILGTSNPSRLKDAVSAENIRLDRKDWYALYQASTGEKLP
ncbi:MAG: aldo/keto reductase [Pseudomonadota bacterium]